MVEQTLDRLGRAFDPDAVAPLVNAVLFAVQQAAERLTAQLSEAPDDAQLKAIQAELEDVFSRPVIPREHYAAWLAPYMLLGLVVGMYDVQQESIPSIPSIPSIRSSVVAAEGYEAPGFLRPQEALDWFRQRQVVDPATFAALDAASKARAFSCARLSDQAALSVVNDSIDRALEQGTPPNQWLTQLEETMDNAGLGLGGTSNYWRLVYDQNTSLALSAGRYVQTKRVAESRPYVLYWNPDPKTDICIELEGKVFRQDDPMVDAYWPPNHFRCKSQFITLDDDELVEEGLEVATLDGAPPVPQGFNYSPADAFFLGQGSPLEPTPEGQAAKQAVTKPPAAQYVEQSPEAAHAALSDEQRAWAEGLSSAETSACMRYTGGEFEGINKFLRTGDSGSALLPPKIVNKRTKALDAALDKASLQSSRVVYRGWSTDQDLGTLGGSTLTDKGFVSTSANRQIAQEFAQQGRHANKVVAEIRLPAGTRAGYMESVLDPSGTEQPIEWEVLLPRGSSFRVAEVDTSGPVARVVMELVR